MGVPITCQANLSSKPMKVYGQKNASKGVFEDICLALVYSYPEKMCH